MSKKETTIVAKLESVSSQRQQYKPYAYNLLPQDVYVEIPIDPDYTTKTSDGSLIISMNGFKAILSSLADAVDELHDE
jgi:hypothetical protein